MQRQRKRPRKERKPYSRPPEKRFGNKFTEPTSLLGVKAELPELKKRKVRKQDSPVGVEFGYSPLYARCA